MSGSETGTVQSRGNVSCNGSVTKGSPRGYLGSLVSIKATFFQTVVNNFKLELNYFKHSVTMSHFVYFVALFRLSCAVETHLYDSVD
jgi:hypothetical protein